MPEKVPSVVRPTSRVHDLQETLRLLHACADSVVKSRLVLALVLVAAGGLLGGLAPLALKALVDEVSDAYGASPPIGRDPPTILLLVGSYIAALAGARLFAALRPLPAGVAEQRLCANLTRLGFARLLGLPLTSQFKHAPGAPVHAVDQAAAGCRILMAHLTGSVVPFTVELCTVVGVLIHMGKPAIVLAFSGCTLAYLSLQAGAAARTIGHAQAVAASAQAVRGSLTEGLSHPENVIGLGAEHAVRQRLDACLGQFERCWRALHSQHARLGIANATCFAVCAAVLQALALHGLDTRSITSGDFVLINVYLLQIMRPLETLGLALRDMAQALGFMRPLLQMIAPDGAPCRVRPEPRAPEIARTRTPAPLERSRSPAHAAIPLSAPAIRFRGVRFGYDASRPVLTNIDLDIRPGSLTGVVGSSGSGKSSLIRLLLRLVEPQAGDLLLDDKPLAAMSLHQLRSTTGVVFQDSLLIDDTIAANIAFGCPGATRSDVETAARRAQLHRRISLMPDGYDTRVGDRGLLLSGGERQRLAIARALVRRPRLLLLDEATSMLDTVAEAALLQGLLDVGAPCTAILVAHRLSSLRLAHRIAVLEGGCVVECDDHASLLARGGVYARLWEAQGLSDGSPCSRRAFHG